MKNSFRGRGRGHAGFTAWLCARRSAGVAATTVPSNKVEIKKAGLNTLFILTATILVAGITSRPGAVDVGRNAPMGLVNLGLRMAGVVEHTNAV